MAAQSSVNIGFEVVGPGNGVVIVGLDRFKAQLDIERAGGFHVVERVQQHMVITRSSGGIEHGFCQLATQAKAAKG